MAELPSLWRTELWHPMVVHFPIVLLIGAAFLRLISKFLKFENKAFLIKTSRLSLFLGIITLWIAVYTGTLADAIVVRELCDPTVLEDHENAGYTIGILFTVVALFDLGSIKFLRDKELLNTISEWVIIVALLVGAGYIGYSAHLGASLVYQQGAAVYEPTAGCSEFD